MYTRLQHGTHHMAACSKDGVSQSATEDMGLKVQTQSLMLVTSLVMLAAHVSMRMLQIRSQGVKTAAARSLSAQDTCVF